MEDEKNEVCSEPDLSDFTLIKLALCTLGRNNEPGVEVSCSQAVVQHRSFLPVNDLHQLVH
jgi:hypothetical protein